MNNPKPKKILPKPVPTPHNMYDQMSRMLFVDGLPWFDVDIPLPPALLVADAATNFVKDAEESAKIGLEKQRLELAKETNPTSPVTPTPATDTNNLATETPDTNNPVTETSDTNNPVTETNTSEKKDEQVQTGGGFTQEECSFF